MATATTITSTTKTTFERFAEENHHPLFNFLRMYKAYVACRQNKRNTASALQFELNYEENLMELIIELRERRYQPSTSLCFYMQKPKSREIFAAAFRDRIVHHLVYQAIAPVWERKFICHSYACRPKKGTHNAANSLQAFLRKVTKNGTRRAYYLKMDIDNFFMSINRPILFELLSGNCKDRDLLWLLEVIIFHDPTADYELQDRWNLRQHLPAHKSLFNAEPSCGLPIGNLTSQFFANVYLNKLDQFVKHKLKCRFYLRYVDDFVLLSPNANTLESWKNQVSDFVSEQLSLGINENATQLAPVAGGVDFAGFIIRPNYKLVRRRVIGNLKEKLFHIQKELVHQTTDYIIFYFHSQTLEKCQATVNSYLGHLKHAQTHGCLQKVWRQYHFMKRFFILYSGRIIRIDKSLPHQKTFKKQILWLHKKFSDAICIVQVGCYFETYNESAQVITKVTCLKMLRNWRGFNVACGFPKKLLSKIVKKLKEQQLSIVIVKQTGRDLLNTKERLIYLILELIQE